MMKNNMKIIKIILILLVITSVFGVIGFTYSYFSLEIEGTPKDVVMNTGDLRLEYLDDTKLSLENALPGDSITKKIIVKNVGTKEVSYNIAWKDLINQINYFDLHLDMKCKSYKNYEESSQVEYGECKSFYKAIPYTETKISKDIKRDIAIEAGVTHVYELTITFLSRNYSQDENLNKNFSGKIELEEYVDDSVYCYSDDDKNYVSGQYTYTSSGSNGWSVQLTDKTSTDPVNTALCTYINNRPITSFSNAFRDSEAVSIDLGKINTKNVTSMYAMFMNTKATTIKGLELFDTSNVNEMQHMFRNTNFLSLDLSSFDTSNIDSFLCYFFVSKATYIDISSFDTSKVINMGSFFNNTQAKYIDLSSFNTSNVTSFNAMFWGTNFENIDLSSFNTSNVIDMGSMFQSSSLKFLDLRDFDTSNVINMGGMFQSSLATEILGVDSFDTSSVTDMSSMFYYSKAINLDLSKFNTEKVTNMYSMFQGSKVKTLDLSSFTIDNVTNMTDMFRSTSATVGYVKSSDIATKFNDSSVTGIPSTLKFVVK